MLKDKLQSYNIILASGSPRRQAFFKELDIDFTIKLKEVEEIYPPELQREAITNFLAELKANAFEGEIPSDTIVITSDTIVWLNNKALGKPKDAQEAFAMICSLSNATHEVYTSVCFKTKERMETFNDVTKVTFNALSDEAIQYYIDKYQPMDKAGAYGIQEWIGLVGIRKIEGSYSNIVGLPVDLVYNKLINFIK